MTADHMGWALGDARIPEDGRRCLECKGPVEAKAGFFELYRQPSGDLYTLCSMDCLAAFVRGGEDD